MTTDEADLQQMITAIAERLGPPTTWPTYPGGYPDEVEAALLDSVFSLSAVYGSPESGARAVVQRWREHVDRPLDSLSGLVTAVDQAGGPEQFKSILKNNAIAVPNAKDQPTKAAAVYGTAKTLVSVGVDAAQDVRERNEHSPKDLYRAITKERGIGEAGATYFLMLLGIQGVKADVMIRRFAARALAVEEVSASRSQELVAATAEALGVDQLSLDYAIWNHESKLSRASRSRRQ